MNEYQKVTRRILDSRSCAVDDWFGYSCAKKLYEQMTLDLAWNEFEFRCACRAFENHFVNSYQQAALKGGK